MKINPTRYSSAVGEVWIMVTLKIKYCHNIFDKRTIREYTDAVLTEALTHYGIKTIIIDFIIRLRANLI